MFLKTSLYANFCLKADVVRVLGKGPETSIAIDEYRVNYETISIEYSSRAIVNTYGCEKQIQSNTVMMIMAYSMSTKLQLSDLPIDTTRLKKFAPSSQFTAYEGFINDEDGVGIRTMEGIVEKIVYLPAKKDRLQCSRYYEPIEDYLTVPPNYHPQEWSGQMTNKNIKEHLDVFYRDLNEDPPRFLVIIIYGTDKEVATRQARFTKAMKARKFDMNRIKFVRGGSWQEIRMRFLIVSAKNVLPRDS